MSLALFSAKSKEAYKLKSNDIEINVDEEDGIKKLNFENTINPDDMIQFNCLYNKAEIDEKIVGDYLEKQGGLDGFGALNIMAGKGITTFTESGRLQEINYAPNLNKLYERLSTSAVNLKAYLTKLQEDIYQNIGTKELIPGAELSIIVDEISTKEVDVSTISKLIAALGNNNTGILSAIDHLYTALGELDTFTVSDFLAATLQKNETMTTIKENKAEKIYEATQENITKYTELVAAIKNLSESLKNILIVEKNLNLRYIEEIKTEKPEDEIPLALPTSQSELAVQEDEKQYIYTYQTASKHADTLTEIINLINTSTENIEKWLRKIEETKTTGIDFTKLSELKIVQKNDDKASYETVPQSLTTFNDVITNLSTNNENISSWINKLNEETILYPDLLEAFGDNLSVVLVNQTTQKPEIKTVKIEFIKETPSPEPSVPDYIVDPNGNNYLYPTKEEL